MDESILNNNTTTTLPDIIYLKEHESFNDDSIKIIKTLDIDFCETKYECAPKYLGIHPEKFCASYIIGAEWLTDNHAIVVMPKIPNLDFIEMFVCALKFEPAAEYFSKFYSIDFKSKPIKTDIFNSQITPLIIIHFIALLRKITKRGLKKSYVMRDENLQSKIKGKIKISQHIKHNIMSCREDRVYCQYQEYTVDNLENRILKKALLYSESYIYGLSTHKSSKQLITTINYIKSYFIDVSDKVELSELKTFTTNKLYKEYADGLRIAKMILKRFNYSISDTKINDDFTPVFWIDMARLYEVYVYSKLYEQYGEKIKFQVPGYWRTAVDFIDTENKIVIDTKYKPKYNESNGGIIADVRQISAYARDCKILNAMSLNQNNIVDCLIIYPEKMIDNIHKDSNDTSDDECNELISFKNVSNLLNNASAINGYKRFYKLSFPMPIQNINNTN